MSKSWLSRGAERALMQLHEVETNVADLDLRLGFDLIFDLLRAYGVASASITRLQKGTYNEVVPVVVEVR